MDQLSKCSQNNKSRRNKKKLTKKSMRKSMKKSLKKLIKLWKATISMTLVIWLLKRWEIA